MKVVEYPRRKHLFFLLFTTLVMVMVSEINTNGSEQPVLPADCNGRLTIPLTEGPYYKAGSPERNSLLEQGIQGVVVTITGYVFDAGCRPLAGVWLDFWQADGKGAYDNSGFKMRGHTYTDTRGRYTLTTVIPGEYPGRTPHIHVKLKTPGGTSLVTQLFFPGKATNARDSIYDSTLLVSFPAGGDGAHADFNFVVKK